jgi:Kef-type K+ transport system membrane component KefB
MIVSGSNSLAASELAGGFLAIAMLLLSASFFGYLFWKMTLPKVIGEIVGGLVLGPTVAGLFMPDWYERLFSSRSISLLYWFGLILLMFISGFEVDKFFKREDKKTIAIILVGSTVIPFSIGWSIPNMYDCSKLMGSADNYLAFQTLFAAATAVTSIPVISKIFMDLEIMESRFAKIVLATAIIHDAILYVAISMATSAVSAKSESLTDACYSGAKTLAFFALVFLAMPKFLRVINTPMFNILFNYSTTGYSLSICFLFVAAAGFININMMFGGFVAGMVIGLMQRRNFINSRAVIKEISLSFFIPLYFALVGLKLDLIHQFDLLSCFGFLTLSSVAQCAGTMLAAKVLKKNWLTSINFAMAMNARGGPGIVLASLAFDLGIISESFFTTLVLTAIVTSLIAGWWFNFILSRGWALLTEDEGSVHSKVPQKLPECTEAT